MSQTWKFNLGESDSMTGRTHIPVAAFMFPSPQNKICAPLDFCWLAQQKFQGTAPACIVTCCMLEVLLIWQHEALLRTKRCCSCMPLYSEALQLVLLSGASVNSLMHDLTHETHTKRIYMMWQVSENMDIAREDSEEQKVAAIQARIRTGDEIWVKVIDVKPGDRWGRGPKVGCSIKAVDRNRSSNRDTPDVHRRRSFSSASSDYDGSPHLNPPSHAHDAACPRMPCGLSCCTT